MMSYAVGSTQYSIIMLHCVIGITEETDNHSNSLYKSDSITEGESSSDLKLNRCHNMFAQP